MLFWRRETPEEKRQRKRQEASISALGGGRLPLAARHRLESQKRRDDGFFTSNLSCGEGLVLHEAGYDPLGTVTGSCCQKITYESLRRYYRPLTGELEALTHGQTEARERCIERLALEAKALGAHGVIGVRLRSGMHPWVKGLAEFSAIGTAIRLPGLEPAKQPFTSHLSGEEFWALRRAGYWPRAMIFGLSCYYVNQSRAKRSLLSSTLGFNDPRNLEVTQYAQGLQQASRTARERLLGAVKHAKAQGAVGMIVQRHLEEREVDGAAYRDLLITVIALGTAVSRLESTAEPAPPAQLVIDLSDGRVRAR